MNMIMPENLSRRAVHKSDWPSIQSTEIFRNLSLDAFEHVLLQCNVVDLRAGKTLLAPGQCNKNIYTLLSGQLHIWLDDPSSAHYLTIKNGECVGEMSVIDGGAVSALVIAVSNCELLEICQEEIWRLINTASGLAANLLMIMTRRIRNDNDHLSSMLQRMRSLDHVAHIDGLTGLYNRRWLDDSFARTIIRCVRNREPVAALMIDVDHFKHFNDKYGHLVGDIALRNIARILSTHIRPDDLLARYGGEEFSVLLPGATLDEANQAAERLCHAVENTIIDFGEYCTEKSTQIHITISIGTAALRSDESLNSLLTRADVALYRAKQRGRNRVESDLAGHTN